MPQGVLEAGNDADTLDTARQDRGRIAVARVPTPSTGAQPRHQVLQESPTNHAILRHDEQGHEQNVHVGRMGRLRGNRGNATPRWATRPMGGNAQTNMIFGIQRQSRIPRDVRRALEVPRDTREVKRGDRIYVTWVPKFGSINHDINWPAVVTGDSLLAQRVSIDKVGTGSTEPSNIPHYNPSRYRTQ